MPVDESACRSPYNMNVRTVSSTAVDSGVLANPWPYLVDGSGNTTARLAPITAQVVDCGLGLSSCQGASGKICLIQLNWPTYYCVQVYNCMKGGGVGVLIYHSNRTGEEVCQQGPLRPECAMPECQSVAYVNDMSLMYPEYSNYGCPAKPAQGFAWPVVMGISLGQGKALKTALDSNPNMQVTLNPCGSSAGGRVAALDFMSGTSMATPAAAGLAGLVWSAHSNCTAAEIRAAATASALDVNISGWDQYTGFGLVQGKAMLQHLESHPCQQAAPSSDQLGVSELLNKTSLGSVQDYLQSYLGTSSATEFDAAMTTCKQGKAFVMQQAQHKLSVSVHLDAVGLHVIPATWYMPVNKQSTLKPSMHSILGNMWQAASFHSIADEGLLHLSSCLQRQLYRVH